ncbi:uncharacterized protein LOC118189925 [Stegodyphus dumicola]|uniref:uncharacterized protein LOC118189925 n=1 Tax=Stegodyphus dumicola TaxID=202533 RepID=UPI0015B1C362|nr:uncharacterized protein LOC118189925 [Stegodyphus dumicola]
MARLGNFLFFIALLYFTEIFSNVMLQTDEEKEIYECVKRQLCECEGGADNYKRCYSYLKEETSQWFIGEVNKCNMGTFTSFDDLVRSICGEHIEEIHDCFIKTERKVEKRMEEASKNPMKHDEFVGLQSCRNCCLPNLSMCVDNPDDCL